MELREFTYDELPFAPGESPFRMKGVAFRETLEQFAKVPDGLERVRSKLATDALRRYFEQPFVAGGWYDVFAMAQLDMAAARAFGVSFEGWLRDSTRKQVATSMSGIYRSLMKLLSPATLAWGLPRIATTYFDFGNVSTRRSSPASVRMSVEGVPTLLVPWFQFVCAEFTVEALHVAGTPEARASWEGVSPTGPRHGVQTSRMEVEFRWKG